MIMLELQKKTEGELQIMLRERRALLEKLRGQVAIGQLKHVDQIGKVRKEIARIMTALNTQKTTHA